MAELLIEKRVREDGVFDEVRVAVVGNVDSGKSTLLGVLSKGVLDNGRGLARLNIFKHKHEVETGRTSDIAKEILGFDQAARPVNYSSIRPPTWPEICESSSKVIMFIDLAGHEKYLKTTVFGLTGNFPDYTMMVVGANMGVVGMTREHYQLTLAMKVPVYMVITKIDMCPANVLENTLDVLQKMLKAPGSMKLPMIVKTREDATTAARNFLSDRLVPIFLISSVTGESLDLLRHFLFMLPPTRDWNALLQQPAEFFLDNTYTVAGVGTVVSGTLMSGVVKLNQTLLLGPDPFGNFIPVQIKGIHTNRLPVKFARAGQSASFALKKTKRKEIRRGMVLADPAAKPQSCWEFDAEILIITHSTTITRSYEAVIHCGCTRQTAKIMGMGEGDVLRSGHRAIVRFRYKQFPEFLKVGERLIFREGKTKGIGRIAKLYPVDGKAPH
jgi:GTPase